MSARASANGRCRPRPGGGAGPPVRARAGPWLPGVLFPRALSAGRYQGRRRWGGGRAGRSTREGRRSGRGPRWAAPCVPRRPPLPPLSPAARRGARPQRSAAALGGAAEPAPAPHRPRPPRAPPARPGARAAERMLIPVLLLLRRRWRRPRDPRKPACWRNSSWRKKVSARVGMRPGAGPAQPGVPTPRRPRTPPPGRPRGWRRGAGGARLQWPAGASGGEPERGPGEPRRAGRRHGWSLLLSFPAELEGEQGVMRR